MASELSAPSATMAKGESNNKLLQIKIKDMLNYFGAERKKFQDQYDFYRRILLIVKIVTMFAQISTMIGSGGVAMYAGEYSQELIPILSVVGTLLFMAEELFKKLGFSSLIDKYSKLALKAMSCQEKVIDLQIHFMADDEVSNAELLEIEQLNVRLKHDITRMTFDIERDQISTEAVQPAQAKKA